MFTGDYGFFDYKYNIEGYTGQDFGGLAQYLYLGICAVLLGILLAAADFKISFSVAILIVVTTVCLQILSNLSNELGDVLHGTDTPDRVGPQYGLNGGELTIPQMKRLIGCFAGLSCAS